VGIVDQVCVHFEKETDSSKVQLPLPAHEGELYWQIYLRML